MNRKLNYLGKLPGVFFLLLFISLFAGVCGNKFMVKQFHSRLKLSPYTTMPLCIKCVTYIYLL